VRNLALLQQQRHQMDALNLQQQLSNGGTGASTSPRSASGASPLNLGHHLSRMQQFAALQPAAAMAAAAVSAGPNFAAAGLPSSMFSSQEIMSALASLPPQQQHNVVTTASALQQLHNNLQQHSTTIINWTRMSIKSTQQQNKCETGSLVYWLINKATTNEWFVRWYLHTASDA